MKKQYIEKDLFDIVETKIERSKKLIEKSKIRHILLERHRLSSYEKNILEASRKLMKKFRVSQDERYDITRKTLKDIIVNMFYFDLASYKVITEFKNLLSSEGAAVEYFDTRLINKHFDKFKEIYFVYYLYNELGMGNLVDDVLQSIIYGEKRRNNDLLNAVKYMSQVMNTKIESVKTETPKTAKKDLPKKEKLTFTKLHEKLKEMS